jgi:hypothetical protein
MVAGVCGVNIKSILFGKKYYIYCMKAHVYCTCFTANHALDDYHDAPSITHWFLSGGQVSSHVTSLSVTTKVTGTRNSPIFVAP